MSIIDTSCYRQDLAGQMSMTFSVFVTFSAIFRLNRDKLVVADEGNPSIRRKPSHNLISLTTFSHARKDSSPGSDERQRAVRGML